MCAKWKSNFDPVLIVQKLEDAREANGNGLMFIGPLGGPRFEGFQLTEIKTWLSSALEFESDIPPSETDSILHSAIFSAAATGPLSMSTLMEHVSRGENCYRLKPKSEFVIVTSISVKPGSSVPRRSIQGSTITFHDELNSSFKLSSLKEEAMSLLSIEPSHYEKLVKVRVNARSEAEAIERATDSLDHLLGIWNLYFNLGVPMTIQVAGRGDKPVNEIRMGPVHSAHSKNGKRTSSLLWYRSSLEFSSRFPIKAFQYDDDLKIFEKRVRKKAKAVHDKLDMSKYLIWYNQALSSADPEATLLSMWALLERMTGTSRQSYSDLIRRLLFVKGDKEIHKQILEHLRDTRNNVAHSASSSRDGYYHVYQLKRYVERFIITLLNELRSYDSLEEFHMVLSMSQDTETLKYRIRTAEMALNAQRKLK